MQPIFLVYIMGMKITQISDVLNYVINKHGAFNDRKQVAYSTIVLSCKKVELFSR